MKRFFDLISSATALLLLSPVLAVVAVMIRIKLGAPIFFTQKRIGKAGREFRMIKFRTMKNAFDANGQPLPDEQRMTAFGNLLRKTSLDELPELLNVLIGEMSLVGPRPLLPQYLSLYTPEQNRRHEVLPGVTGWAQVNGRNSVNWPERFALDVWYVDHRSMWLDAKILGMTVGKVLFPQDISHGEHVTMPEFSYRTCSRIAIIGAGGHAKVVIQTLQAAGEYVSAIYDDDSSRWGEQINGVPITGPIDTLKQMPGHPAMIAIGNNQVRKQLAEGLDCTWVNVDLPEDRQVSAIVRKNDNMPWENTNLKSA